jgi:hypothetical protein
MNRRKLGFLTTFTLALVACAGEASPPEESSELDSPLAMVESAAASCMASPAPVTNLVATESAGGVHVLTDLPYSPTCDIKRTIEDTLDEVRKNNPKGLLILLADPAITITGKAPNRQIDVNMDFVLIKELPIDDGKGGLANTVVIVVSDFDAWASSHSFTKEQLDNIRLRLGKDGVAISGDYTFERSENAQVGSNHHKVKIIFKKGTRSDLPKAEVEVWKKVAKPDAKVVITYK